MMSSSIDHSCRSIMTANVVTLHLNDTVQHGLSLLLANRLLAIPVVTEEGLYRGMFAKSRLIARMMPGAVTLSDDSPNLGAILDISYVSDSLAELHQRFLEIANDPVEKHLITDTPVLAPDTPLMSALLHLYRTRNFLPVVDPGTGQLLGIVSTWDALGLIANLPK